MNDTPPTTDAERIAVGNDPLGDEHLGNLSGLRRVLRRLGHDLDEGQRVGLDRTPETAMPTTDWAQVRWTCPSDACAGELRPVDTGAQYLPDDPAALDETVDAGDADTLAAVERAKAPTVPVVQCDTCGELREASFRAVLPPAAERLPEPAIVEGGALGGAPRIEGTRIGVGHIVSTVRAGRTAREVAREVYPHLSEAHVQAALDWADAHPERLAEAHRENEAVRRRHDILQSVIDAMVEQTTVDAIFTVITNSQQMDPDEHAATAAHAVASALRNGLEQARRVDISIDTDDYRIILDVGGLFDAEPESS